MNKSTLTQIIKEEIQKALNESKNEYTVEYWYRMRDDEDTELLTIQASSDSEALEIAKSQARKSAIPSSFKIVGDKKSIKEVDVASQDYIKFIKSTTSKHPNLQLDKLVGSELSRMEKERLEDLNSGEVKVIYNKIKNLLR